MSADSDSLVYIVDGDPAVRDSLTTLLGLNGYQVESYSTGAAFLKQIQTGVDMECVVCEAELPDTSGIQIFKQIQQIAADTAFALLVSRRNPSITQSARDAGIQAIFSKPLVHRRLIEFISTISH